MSKTITSLPAASASLLADLKEIVQGGISYKVTNQQDLDLFLSTTDFTDTVGGIANAEVAGRQSLWIPGTAFFSANTAGATLEQIQDATNFNNFRGFAFDKDVNEKAHTTIVLPKKWDKGDVTFQIYAVTAATTGDAKVALEARARGVGAVFSATYTSVTVTISAQATAYNMLISAESTVLSIPETGGLSDNANIEFRLQRYATDPGDTLAGDLYVIGVELFYDVTKGNDS